MLVGINKEYHYIIIIRITLYTMIKCTLIKIL